MARSPREQLQDRVQALFDLPAGRPTAAELDVIIAEADALTRRLGPLSGRRPASRPARSER